MCGLEVSQNQQSQTQRPAGRREGGREEQAWLPQAPEKDHWDSLPHRDLRLNGDPPALLGGWQDRGAAVSLKVSSGIGPEMSFVGELSSFRGDPRKVHLHYPSARESLAPVNDADGKQVGLWRPNKQGRIELLLFIPKGDGVVGATEHTLKREAGKQPAVR